MCRQLQLPSTGPAAAALSPSSFHQPRIPVATAWVVVKIPTQRSWAIREVTQFLTSRPEEIIAYAAWPGHQKALCCGLAPGRFWDVGAARLA
jgi:hypothetical protein